MLQTPLMTSFGQSMEIHHTFIFLSKFASSLFSTHPLFLSSQPWFQPLLGSILTFPLVP
jgi:hypothetical protein